MLTFFFQLSVLLVTSISVFVCLTRYQLPYLDLGDDSSLCSEIYSSDR